MGRSNSYPNGESPIIPGAPQERANMYDRTMANLMSIVISKENIPVVVNANTGISDFTGASSSIKVFLGFVEDTINWTITKQDYGVTSTLSGNVITITNITGNLGYVEVTLTNGSTSVIKKISVYNAYREGESSVGLDAPAFYAYTPIFAIPTDSAGANGNFTKATTLFVVMEGGEVKTSEWVISVVSATEGITYNLTNGVLSVTASTIDIGTITIKAVKSGYSDMLVVIPVVKLKQGISGNSGTNGTNGINGTNGASGTNGITPSFQISGGSLQVSYDIGETWTTLGSVAGTNGTNGTNGVSPIFRITSGELEVSYNGGSSYSSLGTVTGEDGANGTNAYLYVAYASDASGTDFTMDSALGVDLPYIAILNTTNVVDDPETSNFVGLWRYVGPKFGDFTRYRLTLPSASTVAGRIAAAVEGTDYPMGWVLEVSSNPTDLKITHGLSLRVAMVSISSVSNGVETLLIGNAAFSGVKSLSTIIAEILSLATIQTQIAIYIEFA